MKFFSQALPAFLAVSSAAAAVIPESSAATKRGLSRRQDQVVANPNEDPQTSFFLVSSLIGPNLANNGLNGGAEVGQVASLTSTNNFMNFCLTTGLPNTNGQQVIDGSCNSVPMGVIVARANMPSSKFQFPPNLAVIPPNQQFTIQMSIRNMASGNFVNPQTNYFSAPQQVNGQGIVIAHSHVVVEVIDSLQSVQVTDPTRFAFFKGLNAAAQGGILSATVTGGLPAGTYRLSSINTAANHQPILGAVAQHGSFDDVVYFTVGDAPAPGGQNGGNNGDDGVAASTATATSSDVASATETASSTVEVPATETATDVASSTEIPVETPTDAAASTEIPVETAVPTEVPVETASTTEAPIDTAVPTEAPVDTAVPTEAPVDTALPTEVPAGTEAPVETAPSTEVPASPTAAPTTVASPAAGASSTQSAAPSATSPAGGNNKGNLQKFNQALGGFRCPSVSRSGRFFRVAGSNSNFNSLRSALQRSCDIQNNQCADGSNSRRFGRFSVADCQRQRRLCLALLPRN